MFERFLNKLLHKQKKLPLSLPDGIHISITEQCFLNCRHCDLGPKPANPREPSTEHWKTAITRFVEWLGPCRIDFAGGEPLCRSDMVELISYAASLNVFPVITTNGLLIDEPMAKRLVEAGLRSINVSLESHEPEIHDFIRNKPGAFYRVKEAIESIHRFRDPGKLNITIATVIMKQNLDSLVPLVKLAKQYNALLNFQCLYQNFGAAFDSLWFKQSELFPTDINRVEAVLDELIQLKRTGAPINNSELHLELMKAYFRDPLRKAIYECQVGERMIAINALGDLALCFFCDPIGNITRDHPRDLWFSEKAREMRIRMRQCKRNCDLLNCNYQRESKGAER